ncbi:MAG: tetratricopeptide repeat protein [Nitrosomonadales bacterium]|nr:tetratricopeptide repeat protein [Nitrosomonadales bacterium]
MIKGAHHKSIPPQAEINEPDPQDINILVDLFRQGRFAETETSARAMTARFPMHGFGWKALGTALLQQGRAAEALPSLQKVVELSPEDALLHNNLGNTLAQLNRMPEAANSYRQAIKLNPGFVVAHYNLGNTFLKLGLLSEAEASYRRALELKPDLADAHYSLGNTLQSQSRLAEAEACYKRALELKPNFAGAHNNLGVTLYDQGRFSEAEISYRQVLQVEPNNIDAHYNLGNTLKKMGQMEAAAACFKRCLEIDPHDRLGARLLLAALGVEPMPLRASEAHMEAFYIKKAAAWDQVVDRSKKYFGAQLVAQALKSRSHTADKLDILDAGCGTGQVGLLIRDQASHLDGVDLSPSMLEKAKEKKVYDNIYLSDLESFMKDHPNQYDAITCAATLIHFGDLSPVLSAAAVSLRDDGLFVFTVFQNDGEPDGKEVVVSQLDGLAKSGCYAHGKEYVMRVAEADGFAVEMLNSEIHEYRLDVSGDIPIMCLVVALRRRPRV